MVEFNHILESLRWSEAGKTIKLLVETTSLATITSAIFGWIPGMIALLPGLYYGVLIWEKVTGKKLYAERRKKQRD